MVQSTEFLMVRVDIGMIASTKTTYRAPAKSWEANHPAVFLGRSCLLDNINLLRHLLRKSTMDFLGCMLVLQTAQQANNQGGATFTLILRGIDEQNPDMACPI